MCVCVFACVCVCGERERERERMNENERERVREREYERERTTECVRERERVEWRMQGARFALRAGRAEPRRWCGSARCLSTAVRQLAGGEAFAATKLLIR